jgi:hypothetical protein
MRPLYNVQCVRCVPWMMCPLNDGSLGLGVPKTMHPLRDRWFIFTLLFSVKKWRKLPCTIYENQSSSTIPLNMCTPTLEWPNYLPCDIKNITNFNSFSSKVTNHLRQDLSSTCNRLFCAACSSANLVYFFLTMICFFLIYGGKLKNFAWWH